MNRGFTWKVIGIMWMSAVGCASNPIAPSDVSFLHSDTQRQSSSVQEIVIRNALSLLGTPYRFGGITPKGFDCTGFINYVYRTSAGIALPRESRDLVRAGDPVSVTDLQPADIVYFRIERQKPLHVGIYLGDGKFIHAPSTGGKVNIQSLGQDYWKNRYLGGRRIVSDKIHEAKSGVTGEEMAH